MNLGKELEKGWLRYIRPLAQSVLMETVSTFIMSGGQKHKVDIPRIARDKMREMVQDKIGLKEEVKKLKDIISKQEYQIEQLKLQLSENGVRVNDNVEEVF